MDEPIDIPTSWTVDPDWPSTSVAAVWLWGSDHPSYLEASVAPITDRSVTWAVDCPSKVCDTTSFAPQTATFDQYNGIWAGERTSKGTTTYWVCDDGDRHPDAEDMGDIQESNRGICAYTTGKSVKRPRLADATKHYDECFFAKGRVPVLVTEGVEELYSLSPYRSGSPNISEYAGWENDYLKQVCTDASDTESSGPATAAAETTTTSTTSDEAEETSTGSDSDTAGTTTEDVSESTPTDGAVRSSLSVVLATLLVATACFANLS